MAKKKSTSTKPLSFSFSKLNTYSKCPFYFKKISIERVPVEEAQILTSGSVIHDILKNYTLKCHAQKKTQLFDQWKDIAQETMLLHKILPEYEDEIMDAVKLYVEANEVQLEGLAGVEEEISIDRSFKEVPWDKAWFRAIIDKLYLIDDQCKISDYKTGFNLKPDKLQLEIYVWLISKLYPHINYFQVELEFTRFNTSRIWEIPKSSIPEIEKKVLNRCKQIEQDTEFEPRVSSLCYECPLWALCPAIKGIGKGKLPRLPQTPPEAQKVLTAILTREKEVKEMKSLLKTYVERNGTVSVEDMDAFYKAIENKSYDIKALVDWANENGQDILDAMNVDGRKIKNFDIPPEIVESKLTTRFTIAKRKQAK